MHTLVLHLQLISTTNWIPMIDPIIVNEFNFVFIVK